MNVTPPANPPGSNQTINVYVTNPQPHYTVAGESSTFAWLTLVAYFFCWPVAAVMNLIGLLTGPKRGCFLAMFLLLLIPSTICIVIMVILAATGVLADLEQELQRM